MYCLQDFTQFCRVQIRRVSVRSFVGRGFSRDINNLQAQGFSP
jgi:hypothetical protein